jgi:hypothetical protein
MNNKRLAPHVQSALARPAAMQQADQRHRQSQAIQPAKPTTAQPWTVTTPRPQPQPAPTVPQRQQQTPLSPAAPRLNHPTFIQRMEDKKEKSKQRKARNAMKYSVDQQKQLERQVVKSGVTTNRVAETISEGVSNLSTQDTNKIGHGLGKSTSNTRGGNEKAVGSFYESLSSNVTNTSEDTRQSSRNTNFSRKVDLGQVVEKREKKKESKKQQQQQSALHQAEHERGKYHISTTSQPQKPFTRNLDGVRHRYEKCDGCNKYWVPVRD